MLGELGWTLGWSQPRLVLLTILCAWMAAVYLYLQWWSSTYVTPATSPERSWGRKSAVSWHPRSTWASSSQIGRDYTTPISLFSLPLFEIYLDMSTF